MRRAFFVVLTAALTSGCSFVYDFDGFHRADAAMPVDAGPELGEPDEGVTNLGVDADVDARVPITREEFATRLRELACAKTVRCTNKLILPEVVQILCHDDVGPELLAAEFIGDTAAAPFDPVAAEECMAALAVTDCSLSNSFLSECEDALRGDAGPGASCVTNYDCASHACVDQEAACGKICEARGSVGFACTDNRECDPLLRCRDLACSLPGAEGEVCDETSDCGRALWCPAATGMCTVAPTVDEPCELGLSGDPCIGGLVCTPVGAGPARTCIVGGDLDVVCDVDHLCRPGFRCSGRLVPGACVPFSGPGGPCDSARNCPFLHECVDSVCVPYPSLGEACTPVMPCVRGICTAGICELQPAGVTCNGRNDALGRECIGYCRGGASPVCADQLGLASTCTEDVECASGLECLGVPGAAACGSCT